MRRTRSIPPVPVRPRKAAPAAVVDRVEWDDFPWGRVGWSPTGRVYLAEIADEKSPGIKNRGDMVKWLAAKGVDWDPVPKKG